jgi:hypothetical protein
MGKHRHQCGLGLRGADFSITIPTQRRDRNLGRIERDYGSRWLALTHRVRIQSLVVRGVPGARGQGVKARRAPPAHITLFVDESGRAHDHGLRLALPTCAEAAEGSCGRACPPP